MLDRLLDALTESRNQAADDVLLEALRLGSEKEQLAALRALLKRKTVRGCSGIIEQYERLPETLQCVVLAEIRALYHALRECGRSKQIPLRLAALKLIALGRQGKLAYVLSENLHDADEQVSRAATEALVALARWIATETRALQRGRDIASPAARESEPTPTGAAPAEPSDAPPNTRKAYKELLDQRPEIEATIARALDVHRGRHGQDLLRAALLLCDWSGSKILAILHTSKHGGQSPLVRRLQQPPASEHVEAFLLGGSHGHLRSHFGSAFAHIDEAPVLDALLRRTHWLKDHNLQVCMHLATRGAWLGESELQRDIDRRTPDDAARIADWLAASGCIDVVQDERMNRLRLHAADSFPARLRIFRAAARQKRGASVELLRHFLQDPDERLVRLATRELICRRPPDLENMLFQLMTSAPESVRRIVSRSIGQAGFEQFWQKFDRLNKATRRQAGRAMLKILPDALARLERRLAAGPLEQRLKAMQIAHELGLGESMKALVLQLCTDQNPRLRSKAVSMAGEVPGIGLEVLVDRLVNDTDARVRANTIEVLESRRDPRLVTILAQRARATNNRERANAIKALQKMNVGSMTGPLMLMLRDSRGEHRISAMWALRQIGWWQLLNEVGRLAKADPDLRVRRYALGILRNVADLAKSQKMEKVA